MVSRLSALSPSQGPEASEYLFEESIAGEAYDGRMTRTLPWRFKPEGCGFESQCRQLAKSLLKLSNKISFGFDD